MLRSTILTRRPLWGYEVVFFDLGCDLFLFGGFFGCRFFPGHMFNSSSILVTGVLRLWFCIEHRMQAHGHSASSIFCSDNCFRFSISIFQYILFFKKKTYPWISSLSKINCICVKINKRSRSVSQTLGRTRTRKDPKAILRDSGGAMRRSLICYNKTKNKTKMKT